jgi:peptidoglycan/LPS O-acetylase OafA/YrhL
MRAVAVLRMILNHAGVPGFAHWAGQAGVSIFFVISGYLITGLLVARRERLVTFWRRRALRLLPALGFLLLVITPLSLLLGRHSAWGDALVGALYVGNWERALGGGMGDLSHLWSLAIEEQFYLVWPLALLFLRPRARWLVALAVGRPSCARSSPRIWPSSAPSVGPMRCCWAAPSPSAASASRAGRRGPVWPWSSSSASCSPMTRPWRPGD